VNVYLSYSVGFQTTLGFGDQDGFVVDTFNSSFTNFDLAHSLGPISAGFPLFARGSKIQTSAGDLLLTGGIGTKWVDDVSIAPAPPAFLRAGLGALCLGAYARLRKPVTVPFPIRE
jgi:hypothetical protein